MIDACRTSNLTVAYHGAPVLMHASFTVPQGVVMGIVGPNGAGKSTLIKSMLGLVKPLVGTVEFFGQPLRDVRRRVGYMPQSTSVDWDFPATVRDVVTMGTYGELSWLKRVGKKQRRAVEQALEQTGITDLAKEQIGQISGGQRQRVFLARALVQSPDLYFMDEPFQGIDAPTQEAIVSTLHTLSDAGKTIVLVHHDLSTLSTYCDHVTFINRRVIASGPVDSTCTSENLASTYDMAIALPS